MKIELKEIDRDSLKVGDVVGVAREVQLGGVHHFGMARLFQ